MKKLLLVLLLLYSGISYGQIGIGISIGAPPPLREEVIVTQPGDGYSWVSGYWYPDGGEYRWHGGYWSRPPYAGARWVGPQHDGHSYHNGYWEGNRGRVSHDHHWDRGHDRDFHHGRRH